MATASPNMIARAIDGDSTALSILLAAAEKPVRRIVIRRIPADLRSVIDDHDVYQEACLDALRAVASFEYRGRGSFQRWLTTLAMHCLRDLVIREHACKRGGRRHCVCEPNALQNVIDPHEPSPTARAARREAEAQIAAALQRLPQIYRDAIRLIYLDERSLAETAARLRRTERSIQNLCQRARRRLQQLVAVSHVADEA